MLMTLTKGFCNLLIKELSKRPSLGVHSPEELACKRPDGDSVVTMSCAWFPAGGSSRKHGTQLGIVSQQVISDRLQEQRKTCLSWKDQVKCLTTHALVTIALIAGSILQYIDQSFYFNPRQNHILNHNPKPPCTLTPKCNPNIALFLWRKNLVQSSFWWSIFQITYLTVARLKLFFMI